MGSTGKGKKLHKAISALIFAVSTGCFMWPAAVQSEYEHHDGTVEVPARVILIKKGDEQVGREVTVKGDGEADIWAYGGEPGGTTTTLNIDGSDAFVDVYGGYHDDGRDGYSGHGDIREKLSRMMDDAQDNREREIIQKIMHGI